MKVSNVDLGYSYQKFKILNNLVCLYWIVDSYNIIKLCIWLHNVIIVHQIESAEYVETKSI